jgi:hypothetical protein
MPSVREIKCPICGVENAPCIVENGVPKYHEERQRAAYPTTYEHPDCVECRKLKDRWVNAESSYKTFRPDFGDYKSKSKWPKAWKEESHNLEMAKNDAKAEYEVHLGTVHKDENHQRDLGRNLMTLLREGRLKP